MVEPIWTLWDGEKMFRLPMSEAEKLIKADKAQRADVALDGQGLRQRDSFKGGAYRTRNMTAETPAKKPAKKPAAKKEEDKPATPKVTTAKAKKPAPKKAK